MGELVPIKGFLDPLTKKQDSLAWGWNWLVERERDITFFIFNNPENLHVKA